MKLRLGFAGIVLLVACASRAGNHGRPGPLPEPEVGEAPIVEVTIPALAPLPAEPTPECTSAKDCAEDRSGPKATARTCVSGRCVEELKKGKGRRSTRP